MIKSTNFLPKMFFNYLGEENSAIFLAHTNLYLKESFNDGIVWIQTDENDRITGVIATGENSNCICFVEDKADFDELSFILNEEFTSPDALPFEQIDKNYLLLKTIENPKEKKGIDYKDFAKIKALDGSGFSENTDIVALKMFFNLKGICEGVLINENGEDISGGFITFSDNFAVITDVFTKEEQRCKGYGKRLVEKLLNCSTKENIYLISQEHNLNFYKKLDFSVVKEIYQYKKGI